MKWTRYTLVLSKVMTRSHDALCAMASAVNPAELLALCQGYVTTENLQRFTANHEIRRLLIERWVLKHWYAPNVINHYVRLEHPETWIADTERRAKYAAYLKARKGQIGIHPFNVTEFCEYRWSKFWSTSVRDMPTKITDPHTVEQGAMAAGLSDLIAAFAANSQQNRNNDLFLEKLGESLANHSKINLGMYEEAGLDEETIAKFRARAAGRMPWPSTS